MKSVPLPKARSRRLLLSFAAALWLALPASSAGCGQTTACFEWSQVKGACPAQDKALPFFVGPSCGDPGATAPGNIASVDSVPTFENDLCCYAVTKLDAEPCTTPPACLHCQEAIATPNVDAGRVCSKSLMAFNDLKFCACTTTCASVCTGDFCAGAMAGAACSACLGDSVMGCGNAFSMCVDS